MRFKESHEWVKVSDETATVGISKYAQKELGEVVHVELPRVGATLKADEEAVVLESTKAAVDIYSPLSGTIVEVNGELKKHPELISESPEEKGWFFKIKMADPSEYESLLSEKEYRTLIEKGTV